MCLFNRENDDNQFWTWEVLYFQTEPFHCFATWWEGTKCSWGWTCQCKLQPFPQTMCTHVYVIIYIYIYMYLCMCLYCINLLRSEPLYLIAPTPVPAIHNCFFFKVRTHSFISATSVQLLDQAVQPLEHRLLQLLEVLRFHDTSTQAADRNVGVQCGWIVAV